MSADVRHVIPQDDITRKAAPMCRGLLDYFPAACFEVAAHSLRSDRKHNPDKPEGADPHWAREKSTDHDDCIVRHTAERGSAPLYHLTARAWRALAALQEYCEQHGGMAPGLASVFPSAPEPPRENPTDELALKARGGELHPALRFHVFDQPYGRCLKCGISQREAVGTVTVSPCECAPSLQRGGCE